VDGKSEKKLCVGVKHLKMSSQKSPLYTICEVIRVYGKLFENLRFQIQPSKNFIRVDGDHKTVINLLYCCS